MATLTERDVVFRGTPSRKEVWRWGFVRVTPFIGVVGQMTGARIVTGLHSEVAGASVYWGSPRVSLGVLQPWSVMKTLERMEEAIAIYDGMIRAIWCLAGYDDPDAKSYFDTLAAHLGGRPQLDALRKAIPTFLPSRQELSIVVGRLTARDVNIVDLKLIRAIDDGHIKPTKRVEGVIHQMRARMSA